MQQTYREFTTTASLALDAMEMHCKKTEWEKRAHSRISSQTPGLGIRERKIKRSVTGVNWSMGVR